MNALTREILIEAAQDHPKEAQKNDSDFRELVRELYWKKILDQYEKPICDRATHLWRLIIPGDFQEEAALDFDPAVYDRVLRVYQICKRILERKIERDPALQLETWSAVPGYQMKLF